MQLLKKLINLWQNHCCATVSGLWDNFYFVISANGPNIYTFSLSVVLTLEVAIFGPRQTYSCCAEYAGNQIMCAVEQLNMSLLSILAHGVSQYCRTSKSALFLGQTRDPDFMFSIFFNLQRWLTDLFVWNTSLLIHSLRILIWFTQYFYLMK